MRAEVIAVGTELLLGYVVDTNSAWIGDQLAQHGVDCLLAVKVGDNQDRIAAAITAALGRADAVICCGGLGPTQDDVTREAIAQALGVGLRRDPAIEARIEAMFASARHPMPDNNRRQADVPDGAAEIPQVRGTAPGLICSAPGGKVVYAVPGVPGEMREMLTRAVLPDMVARQGSPSVIASRTLRTWGLGESGVAAVLAPRIAALDASGNPAIAFLASAGEGIKVRLTAKVGSNGGAREDAAAAAAALLDAEEAEVRAVLGDRVFGVDDETMEAVVAGALLDAGRSLAVAESLTGGLLGARLTDVAGASRWFRGGVVSYASDVKREVLGVPDGPVVRAPAAEAMAAGVARLLRADVGLAVTGVAGPEEQEGQPVGTVWIGSSIDGVAGSQQVRLPGLRADVRALSVLAALDHLRRRLMGLPPG